MPEEMIQWGSRIITAIDFVIIIETIVVIFLPLLFQEESKAILPVWLALWTIAVLAGFYGGIGFGMMNKTEGGKIAVVLEVK